MDNNGEWARDAGRDSPLLTQDEAAAYLRVCRNTMRGLGLPSVRIRRRLLFRRSDLDAYIERHSFGAPAAAASRDAPGGARAIAPMPRGV